MSTADLTPANQNPWYILMTLYGEQEGEWIDLGLAEKNRKAWNGWACRGMTPEALELAINNTGIEPEETQLTDEALDEIKQRFVEVWRERNSGMDVPDFPDPTKPVDLLKIILRNSVELSGMIFGSVANFSDAIFAQSANFYDATFIQNANFHDATFAQNANFLGVYFAQYANFSAATFVQTTNFDYATFTQSAHFSGAIFTQYAIFSGATFTQYASFSGASFTQYANFSAATFTQVADFFGATFTQHADFSGATFTQDANFIGATFTQDADFSHATFTQDASFSAATFEGVAGFGHVTFDAEPSETPALNFSGVQMNGPVNFERAKFKHHYPKLTNATLHKSVQVTADEDHWPRLPKALNIVTGMSQRPSIRNQREAKESAAKLRHAMALQALPEEEHFFFRREMHHGARVEGWWKTGLIRLYEIFSGFGHSIWRPGLLLLTLLIVGSLIYWRTTDQGFWQSAGYSFATMFKFFGLQRTYFDLSMIDGWPGWVQWFSASQTVVSYILLFFLGLGLRTRFRLR